MTRLRPATFADIGWLAPIVLHSHVLEDEDEVRGIVEGEPWRLQVTHAGDAVLLGRWRTHLDACAIQGLWCAPRRAKELLTALLAFASERGFDTLVSPLLTVDAARPYVEAGMPAAERVAIMRLDARAAQAGTDRTAPAADGITVRDATASDIEAPVALDAQCFDAFWRYDVPGLARLASGARIVVAHEGERAVGYVLATRSGSQGSVGRLAVIPGYRGRGIGRYLALCAIEWICAAGATTVVLTVREDDTNARALYDSLCFKRVPGHLVVCVSGHLTDPR